MNILKPLNRSWLPSVLLNIFLIALFWLPYVLGYSEMKQSEISMFGMPSSVILNGVVSLLIQFIIIILLLFGVSRLLFVRYINIITYLPFTLMMLFAVCWQATHAFGNHTIATVFVILALVEIVRIDVMKDNTSLIFNMFVSLIVASVFQIDFLFFIPFFILGMFILDGFKCRSVLVILFVLLVGAVTMGGYAYVFDCSEEIKNYYLQVLGFGIQLYSWEFVMNNIVFFVMALFAVISLFFYFQNQGNLRFKTKKTVAFWTILWLFTTAYIFLFGMEHSGFELLYVIQTTFFMLLTFVDYRSDSKRVIFNIMLSLLFISYICRMVMSLVDVRTYMNSLQTALSGI